LPKSFRLFARGQKKKNSDGNGLQNICISAILQSRQYCLPKLYEPKSFHDAVMNANAVTKLIAHCEDTNKNELKDLVNDGSK
jgi:16S rRNA (uracil1498-N3)-methyltransferase